MSCRELRRESERRCRSPGRRVEEPGLTPPTTQPSPATGAPNFVLCSVLSAALKQTDRCNTEVVKGGNKKGYEWIRGKRRWGVGMQELKADHNLRLEGGSAGREVGLAPNEPCDLFFSLPFLVVVVVEGSWRS